MLMWLTLNMYKFAVKLFPYQQQTMVIMVKYSACQCMYMYIVSARVPNSRYTVLRNFEDNVICIQ